MPELQAPKDLIYLREKLAMDLNEYEANDRFKEEISNCLNDVWRKWDGLFHNLKRN